MAGRVKGVVKGFVTWMVLIEELHEVVTAASKFAKQG
jgi:hypothetical protein